jgi:hypothetical protein
MCEVPHTLAWGYRANTGHAALPDGGGQNEIATWIAMHLPAAHAASDVVGTCPFPECQAGIMSRGENPRDRDASREWPDGPIKDYLHNLSRPDNDRHPEREEYSRTCCDAGDTVKTKFKVEPSDARHPEDLWYAWLNEKWVLIPHDKIVASYAPDGQAYLFMMDFAPDYDYEPMSKIIVCFVRPKGGL